MVPSCYPTWKRAHTCIGYSMHNACWLSDALRVRDNIPTTRYRYDGVGMCVPTYLKGDSTVRTKGTLVYPSTRLILPRYLQLHYLGGMQ